jgi:1,6-anhydro-N-acetylmuramate kinase
MGAVKAIGLMSGTSLDGVDVALIAGRKREQRPRRLAGHEPGEIAPHQGERGEDGVAHPDAAGRIDAQLALAETERRGDCLPQDRVLDLLQAPDPSGDRL